MHPKTMLMVRIIFANPTSICFIPFVFEFSDFESIANIVRSKFRECVSAQRFKPSAIEKVQNLSALNPRPKIDTRINIVFLNPSHIIYRLFDDPTDEVDICLRYRVGYRVSHVGESFGKHGLVDGFSTSCDNQLPFVPLFLINLEGKFAYTYNGNCQQAEPRENFNPEKHRERTTYILHALNPHVSFGAG